jgi:hypothetical protein
MLMTMGILYDADCMKAAGEFRHLKWVCEEMADAAACCARQQRWQDAEDSAAEILRRNLAENEGEAEWKLTEDGDIITVELHRRIKFSSPLLFGRMLQLSYKAAI